MVSKVFYGKSGSCANFRYLMKWMAWTDRLHFIVRAAKQFSMLKLHATCLHYSNSIPELAN